MLKVYLKLNSLQNHIEFLMIKVSSKTLLLLEAYVASYIGRWLILSNQRTITDLIIAFFINSRVNPSLIISAAHSLFSGKPKSSQQSPKA